VQFVIIKNGVYNNDTIREVVQPLLGNNIKIVNDGTNSIIYHNYNDEEEIRRMLAALEVELMANMYAYLSNSKLEDRIDDELEIAKILIDYIPRGIYNLKEALLRISDIPHKEKILSFILKYTGISQEFIKGFVMSDLNVSKASKEMFIHRNTMIYKLDKLYSVSGFDLRCFKDAYILYSLIENK